MNQPLSRRSFMLSSLAWAASTYAPLTSATASAIDSWPKKPVRVFVTVAIGSGADLQARALCERLSTIFKQPFIVDNKPGANGTIAAMSMLRSEADGYSLLYSTASGTVMAEALMPKLPFSTLRDMAPVALTVVGGVLFVANPEFPARTLPELVEVIKRNPDKYSYGSWGGRL